MEVKLNLSNSEHKDLISFCNLNDLLVSQVVKDSFTTGFNIERYGLLNSGVSQEKQVEKEVIVEESSSEISMSTLIVDEGGKFNQTSLSNALKKGCDKLVTKLLGEK